MDKSQINAAELDVSLIAENFKKYLSTQDNFKDYNFEGSNLSVLIDILSYNTHYNNLYTNFSLNEVFLDSAVKRDSVVSIAKNLGYTPRSAISAKAVVNITVTATSTGVGEILIIPKGAVFNSTTGNNLYPFTTIRPYTAVNIDGVFVFNNVFLYQGDLLTNTYIYQEGIRFIIPNTGCDLTTLNVKVQESTTNSNFSVYSNIESIVDSQPDSLVYYVKEIGNQLYEIYFGGDVIGKQPTKGNVIILEYLSTSGEVTNGTKSFTYNGDSLAGGQVTVTTISQANSGKDIESVDSIRVNAPNLYAAQNRGVNANDYKSLIYNNIPEIDSISVWGGEDNIPVQYGKVFISIKPTSRDRLSTLEKTGLLSFLKKKTVLGITPEIVDPDVIDIIVDSTLYYDPALTSRDPNELSLLATQVLSDYNQEISRFNENFKYSKLSTMLDSSDRSITNSITNVRLVKKFFTPLETNVLQTINIFNPIDTLKSSSFYTSGISLPVYLELSGNTIVLYTVIDNEITRVRDAGSVNKSTGEILIKNINITSLIDSEDSIELYIKPASNDIISKLNQVPVIDLTKSKINMIVNDSNNYIFTNSQ